MLLSDFIDITLQNCDARVSSRLPIKERLVRCIELVCKKQGYVADPVEIDTVATLILVRFSEMPHPSKWTMDLLDELPKWPCKIQSGHAMVLRNHQ